MPVPQALLHRAEVEQFVLEYVHFNNFERISLKNGFTPVEIRCKAASTIAICNGILCFFVYCSGNSPAFLSGLQMAAGCQHITPASSATIGEFQ